ncbi:MAG: hypothetical protein AAGL49_15425 [Pseudomonadota bacterium]
MAETDSDYERGTMDTDAQQRTYEAVMRFSGFVGVPLSLALTGMFTALAARAGLGAGVMIGIVVFFASRAIFKLFFK